PCGHDDPVGHKQERHPYRPLGRRSAGAACGEHGIQEGEGNGGAHAAQNGASIQPAYDTHFVGPPSPRRLRNGSLRTISVTSAENRYLARFAPWAIRVTARASYGSKPRPSA